ncbi:MAG: amidohydrolase [Gemmatimonadales bacterium]|nr:MAG: amidohydrolase [Gemmatimonadales bacterium]
MLPFHRSLRLALSLAMAVLLLQLAACEEANGPDAPDGVADLVLLDGKVVTLDDEMGEAEAVAVRDGRIVAVGSSAEIGEWVGSDTEVVELDGRLVIPGFVEGHGHFMGLGEARLTVDLSGTTSWEEIIALVEEAVEEAEPGEWITGRGWHQERWDPAPDNTFDGVPTHHSMTEVSPDNPVLLTHASGHASFANGPALQEAGITADSPDPSGGTIVRDDAGEPTGFLRQAAQGAARFAHSRFESQMSDEERHERRLRQVELAGEEALAHGVTSFHDQGSSFSTIELFRDLADAGELPVRLHVAVRGESMESMRERLQDYRMVSYGDHFLTVRAIKRAIDGALGTHGAWKLEPYADMPESTGLPQTEPSTLRELAELALENGYQLHTHAIGDRGNREALDIYEEVLQGVEDHRWRIEHAQHLHPDDIPRFAELGVIASMQGIHGTSDGPWIEPRLGEERARSGAYVWRDLLDSGATICNGTDVPVEPISPIESYFSSVTRVMRDGEAFFPEQAMTRMEALRSYTLSCHEAAFHEEDLGRIAPGMLADLVVLDRDLLTVPDEEIQDTRVDLTILNGEVRYRR